MLPAPLKGISHMLMPSSIPCSGFTLAGADASGLLYVAAFPWPVQSRFKQQASQRNHLSLVCCLVREKCAVSSSSSRLFHAICIWHTPRGHEAHEAAGGLCRCSDVYNTQTILQAIIIRCINHLAACAGLGHEELTSAEVGSSVGIYRPQLLSRANPLEFALAFCTPGQSWEVECFHCILDIAAPLWWAEHELSIAPAGAFQGGIPMIAIPFLESLMTYRLMHRPTGTQQCSHQCCGYAKL